VTVRPALAFGAAAVLGMAAPPRCAAQLEASLDAGASYVKYDGFLGSGAASLTPSVTWRSTRVTLATRGTVLVFESGNTSVLGQLTGGVYSRPLGPVRLEAGGEAGFSAYASFARFAQLLGSLRAHLLAARRGAWAGPLVGQIALGGTTRNVAGVGAGVWTRRTPGALSLAASRIRVGDTAFTDVEARLRWTPPPRRFDIEASFGTRFASRNGGRGAYGDLSATARITERLALVVAGGRYPSDPVRGSIPGRFVTVGLRVAPRPVPLTSPVHGLSWRVAESANDAPRPTAAGMRLTIAMVDGLHLLTIRVAGGGVNRVEIMGDFTSWQPIALIAAGEGRFEYVIRLTSGMYRFNARVDNGPWVVPQGADVAEDEFGGHVGVLVVP
jgi:hypothetical protein